MDTKKIIESITEIQKHKSAGISLIDKQSNSTIDTVASVARMGIEASRVLNLNVDLLQSIHAAVRVEDGKFFLK